MWETVRVLNRSVLVVIANTLPWSPPGAAVAVGSLKHSMVNRSKLPSPNYNAFPQIATRDILWKSVLCVRNAGTYTDAAGLRLLKWSVYRDSSERSLQIASPSIQDFLFCVRHFSPNSSEILNDVVASNRKAVSKSLCLMMVCHYQYLLMTGFINTEQPSIFHYRCPKPLYLQDLFE